MESKANRENSMLSAVQEFTRTHGQDTRSKLCGMWVKGAELTFFRLLRVGWLIDFPWQHSAGEYLPRLRRWCWSGCAAGGTTDRKSLVSPPHKSMQRAGFFFFLVGDDGFIASVPLLKLSSTMNAQCVLRVMHLTPSKNKNSNHIWGFFSVTDPPVEDRLLSWCNEIWTAEQIKECSIKVRRAIK